MADITEIIAKSRPEPGSFRTLDTDALLATAQRQTVLRRGVVAGVATAGVVGIAAAVVGGPSSTPPPTIEEIAPLAPGGDADTRADRREAATELFTVCAREHGFDVTHLQLHVTDDWVRVASGGLMSVPHTDERTGEEHAGALTACSERIEEEFGASDTQ